MKKILFVTYDFPYPTTSGGKVRAYNLIKYCAKEFDVFLYSFTRKEITEQEKESLLDLGVKKIFLFPRRKILEARNLAFVIKSGSIFETLYYENDAEEQLIKIIKDEGIEILLCESFYTAFYINKNTVQTGVKTIFGTENIEHVVYKEYVEHQVSPFLRALYAKQVNKIKEEELKVFRKSDLILAVTERERKIAEEFSDKKCYVVENGVDIKDFPFKTIKKAKGKNVLFIGNFTYFPNKEAAKFIKQNLVPVLTNMTFTIIGKNSTQVFSGVSSVVVKEYVDDIKEEYEKADVFIFPVKFGGGTNFKLLEAMASGVPVVGFSEKIENLGALDKVHFLAAENKEDFLRKINSIFQDEDLRNKIAKNARGLIEKNYEWEKIGKKMNSILKSL